MGAANAGHASWSNSEITPRPIPTAGRNATVATGQRKSNAMPKLAEKMLEAAGIGGWELDVTTGEVGWTKLAFRILDLGPSEPPPQIGAIDFCAPEVRPVLEDAVNRSIRCGAQWDLKLPFVTMRGRNIWVRTRGQAIRENGKTTKLVGTFEDITAGYALAQHEARLAMVARQMAHGVIFLDRQGLTEWINEAFTRVTGYTIEDLRGCFPGALLNGPETDPATVCHITDCIRDGLGFEAETLERRKDGRSVWLSVAGSPVRSAEGVLTGFVAVVTDVTTRHEADRLARHEAGEREHAEALLRDVLDTLPSAVTAYDHDDRFILCNSRYAEMFPISARFAIRGRTHAQVVRLAAEHGQYADAPTDPPELDAWVQAQMEFHVSPTGAARTLRLGDGRVMQVRERRSRIGTVVTVRTDTTDLHAAEAKARHEAAERERAEALLRDVLDTVPTAICAYDADDCFILCNRAYTEKFPVAASFVGPSRRYEDVVRHDVQRGHYAAAGTTPEEQEAWIAMQMAKRSAGGTHTWRLADGRAILGRERRSESGNLVCVQSDVTELMQTQALLRDVLDTLPSGVIAFDRDERFVLSNRAHAEMVPIVARFLDPGLRLEDLVRLTAENAQVFDVPSTPAEREAWIIGHLAALRDPDAAAHTLRTATGGWIQIRTRLSETGNRVIVLTDTTDLKRAEHDLRIQAERDPLTLLANRASFLAALDGALADVASNPDREGVVLLLDVDYFKQVNDALGHDAGDALLLEIAARLCAVLRDNDVAARLGGDEFGVVMPGVTDAEDLAKRMDAILAALSTPLELAGRRLPVGVSVGVTMFPSDSMDGAKLLKNADLALYEAKRQGRGRWSAFRPEQSAAIEHTIRLADALRQALAQNRITVALQPKRWLYDDRHAGFEALARWHDGKRWVPPAEFIPVAEDTGLIGALGRAVMEATLARVRDLCSRGLDPGRVAVNVAGPQLLDSHFLDETMAALRRHTLRPADLELELTETLLFGRAAERIDAVLRQFSQLGVTLALDDFGTGYASLSLLSRLPINRLKIDTSFVAGIGGGGPGSVNARAVVSLAHSLQMEVIAEGVETTEQMAFLQTAGCDIGQGNLFSNPLLTTDEAAEYLRGQAMRGIGTRHDVADTAWN